MENLPQIPEENLHNMSEMPTIGGRRKLLVGLITAAVVILGWFSLAQWAQCKQWWPWYNLLDSCMNVYDGPSNWQTYRNEQYGFEVKYPTDWIYEPLDDADEGAGINGNESDKSIYRLRFVSKIFVENRENDKRNFTFEIVPQESQFYKASLREFVNSLKDWDEYKPTIKETQLVVLGADDSFTRDVSLNGKSFRIISFLKKNNNIYVISAIFSNSQVVLDTYYQILSTFKFIEPNPQTNSTIKGWLVIYDPDVAISEVKGLGLVPLTWYVVPRDIKFPGNSSIDIKLKFDTASKCTESTKQFKCFSGSTKWGYGDRVTVEGILNQKEMLVKNMTLMSSIPIEQW